MDPEKFVMYVFDKTVETYAAMNHAGDSLDTAPGKDKFDKIYRFLEHRFINHLNDAKVTAPVKSPLS